MDELYIFGTGEHSRKIFHCANILGFNVKGFIDQDVSRKFHLGRPVFLLNNDFLIKNRNNVFIAIGNGKVRADLHAKFLDNKFTIVNLIHPSAYVSSDVKLGKGIFVGANSTVETGSIIEDGSIVDIGVIIDHDCVITKFFHLTPGAIVQARTICS